MDEDQDLREKPENPGHEIVRWLGPAGCALVLLLTAAALVMLLTHGSDPIPGYAAPHDAAYYAVHTDELAAELETGVFPHLAGSASCEAGDGTVTVTLTGDGWAADRAVILRYYDERLFVFITPQAERQNKAG